MSDYGDRRLTPNLATVPIAVAVLNTIIRTAKPVSVRAA